LKLILIESGSFASFFFQAKGFLRFQFLGLTELLWVLNSGCEKYKRMMISFLLSTFFEAVVNKYR